KITDRSLELLGGISSLEEVELSAVPGVTNAGVAALTRLPKLREVRLSGQRLTREVLSLFPPNVRVHVEV
ncbi:MAG TPA: hypothetical protein VHV78_13775, partial [Gemmatimonadaceae bacterium]|nr:hypothetical protein [Gemmatimonadaceae bacterium]